jgi:hypothetical protein
VIYRAAAALAHDDRAQAITGLRDQLTLMARAAGATADWSTLTVEGPVAVASGPLQPCFEWAACVTVDGVPFDDGRLDLLTLQGASAHGIDAPTCAWPAAA